MSLPRKDSPQSPTPGLVPSPDRAPGPGTIQARAKPSPGADAFDPGQGTRLLRTLEVSSKGGVDERDAKRAAFFADAMRRFLAKQSAGPRGDVKYQVEVWTDFLTKVDQKVSGQKWPWVSVWAGGGQLSDAEHRHLDGIFRASVIGRAGKELARQLDDKLAEMRRQLAHVAAGQAYPAPAPLTTAVTPVSELRRQGWTAGELRVAGYRVAELLGAGFDLRDLRGAGFCLRELRGCQVTARNLAEAGFSASVDDLLSAGYPKEELLTAGFLKPEAPHPSPPAGSHTCRGVTRLRSASTFVGSLGRSKSLKKGSVMDSAGSVSPPRVTVAAASGPVAAEKLPLDSLDES